MERVAIHSGVNGDRADPEFFTSAENAQGDFAAIGDQDLVETHRSSGSQELLAAAERRLNRFEQPNPIMQPQ